MATHVTTGPHPIVAERRSLGQRLSAAYGWMTRAPLLACAIAALAPLLIRIALLTWYPVPAPAIHDEFSYLLGADTFAHGRVTNPQHPMWQHFETFHVLQQPTYASKYPPAQALSLAAGQILGDPWIGVLLSSALMCGVFCWTLQGWLAPPVAFAGALLAALRLGIASYWTNSYWGGAVAAIGGALVIGALPRLLTKPARSTAFLFAIGLVILGNSRPYEGLLLAVPAIGVLIVMSVRKRNMPLLLRTATLPVLATLIPAALAMLYYNHRVTHHWLSLPYVLHEQQYAVAPGLLFQQPRTPPVYHHAVMQDFWQNWDRQNTEKAKAHWISGFKDHVEVGMLFFFGPLWLALLTILLPHPRGNLADRVTFPILLFFLAGLLPEKDVPPHYWAPITALLFVRFMNAIVYLWSWKPAKLLLGPAVAMIVMLCTLLLSVVFLKPMLATPARNTFALERKKMEARLNAMPGQQLVVVRYAPTHSPHLEWVYNRADIDASKIVWARDMGEEKNAELKRYFATRSIWLLEPDKPGTPLTPY